MRIALTALLVPLLFLVPRQVQAQTPDVDVLHYGIHLDSLDRTPGNEHTRFHSEVTLVPLVANLNQFSLDLLELTVDSIQIDGVTSSFSHNDTLLQINTPVSLNPGDTAVAVIWYQGKPVRDPSFGGFYFMGDYTFNIGIGLDSDPHNLGRVWFPCKDNFRDRAFFDFFIRVDSALTAVCNGTLVSNSLQADGTRIWHWNLEESIPSYLAGMAVAPYVPLQDEYIGQFGDTIPLLLYALPGDTNNVLTQSANLQAAISAFETRFGRYEWERIGYVMVNIPLSGPIGAMEHATSVAFPRVLLPFGSIYETVWAHEISHAWFGNLATCESAEEMWLNEGWASFCEAIFTEAVYGREQYDDYLHDLHFDVLLLAHLEDGGYQALSAVPTEYTYGRTVYHKGAGVAHTLRHQLGDSVFFRGIRRYLSEHSWEHVSSDSMRVSLEAESGRPLSAFFDGWVHEPGFANFSVDSVKCTPIGPMTAVEVHIRQRLRGASNYADSVRIPVRLQDAFGNIAVDTAVVSGASTVAIFSFPNCPEAVSLDPGRTLADATTDGWIWVRSTGLISIPNTTASIEVDSLPDSAWVRVVHHWVAPDPFQTPVPFVSLSGSRYWKVEGDFPPGFHAFGRFAYNGGNLAEGALDRDWFTTPEDSLRIYYRPSAQFDWTEVAGATLLAGNPNDRRGEILVPNLQSGEYTLAQYTGPVGLSASLPLAVRVFPNPNPGGWLVELPADGGKYRLRLVDVRGKTILSKETDLHRVPIHLSEAEAPNGVYFLEAEDESGRRAVSRIVIQR